MSRGVVRVTPQYLANALFPGADVKVLRVAETIEDLAAGTVSVLLCGDVFRPVPEGCMAPYYVAEVTRRDDGSATTEFKS